MTRAARVALALGVLGTAFRVALVLAGAPPTNSDEATIGLMAVHIVERGAHPVFFYGQHYMGALEAYLAAPLFWLAAPSVTLLRLTTVALYAAFLAAMYLLTRRLYTPWFAVAVVGLLALGSDRVLKDQLIAGGGYPEINALAAGLLLGALYLATTAPRRPWPYLLWGLGAGLAIWADFLVVPYVAAAGAVLLAGRGRALWSRAGGALAAGGLLGLAPLIVHDLTTPLRDNSLAVLLHLSDAGADQAAAATLADQLHGGVLFGIPLATGVCPPSRCDPAQFVWGAAYLPLLLAAGALALIALRRLRAAATSTITDDDRRLDRLRQAGRLALIAAAGITIIMYVRSPAAALTPAESGRYLSCLLVSTPAVLWPLWSLATRRSGATRPARGAAVIAGLAAAVLGAVLVAATAATVSAVGEVGRVRANDRDHRAAIGYLDGRGVTRVYGEYWTCNRLTFQTRERIVCAVLGDDLSPGFDRHPPYRAMVRDAPDPGYLVLAGSPLDRALVARLAGRPVEVHTFGDYRVYLPTSPLM